MLNIVDPEALGSKLYVLPNERGGSNSGGCKGCEAYRPEPQLNGALSADPDIELLSPGMNVDIALYYNSSTERAAPIVNGPVGYCRNLSPLMSATMYTSGLGVVIQRGNGALVSYTLSGGVWTARTAGVLNTISVDVTSGDVMETTPEGVSTVYPGNAGLPQPVSRVQDAVGNIHSYLYSGGKLQNIQDGAGRLVSFLYSGSLLQTIEDWAGRRTTFQFDTVSASPLNLLTTVIGPTGCQTGYQYAKLGSGHTADWLLTGITDPNGFQTQYTYSAGQQVLTKAVSGAGTTSYAYFTGGMTIENALGQITTQLTNDTFANTGNVDALGNRTTVTLNSNNQVVSTENPLGATATNIWSGGMLIGQINPLGYQTTITRDGFNNITSEQSPDGAIWTTVWGFAGSSFDTTGVKRRKQVTIDPLGNRVTMAYTAQGLLRSTQDMTGALVTLGYNSFGDQIFRQDAMGGLWTTTRDLAGNPIAQINPLNAIQSQTFDNQNRPLIATDAMNNVNQNGYDSVGNRVVAISPMGFRTSWTFNVFDAVVSQQDALGNFGTNVYDLLGRRIATIDSLGGRASTTFDVLSRVQSTQNQLNAIVTNVWNAASQLVAVQNPVGSTSTIVRDLAGQIVARVDALGNRSSVVIDGNGRQIATMNPLGFLATTIYSAASKVIAQVDALGNRSSTVFDSRLLPVARIDPLNRITTAIFNANMDQVAAQDAAGFLSSTILDGARNVIGSIDSNNNRSTVVRDLANRPIAQVNALNFRSSTSYDANSNPVQTIDPLNRISTNVMDALNRVQASITPLGFITTVNRDADGRTVSVQNASGFLSSTVFNAASQQIASISPLGLIQTTIRDIAGQVTGNQNSLSQIYTNVLDANGAAIATVSPMGFRASIVLDAASQRVATIDALGNRASSVWAANGQLIASQSELGFLTSFILDAASQRVCVVDANNGRSSTVFDVRGLVSVEIDQLNARTSFSHDNNRNTTLRVDARNWPTSYTIDQLNRTAQTQYIDNTRVTNSWDAAGQQIVSADSTGITSYVWDLDSRKTATQNPTGINLTSTLDPLGNRLLLQDNYGTTSYAWDSASRLTSIWNPLNERTSIAYDALDREQHRVLGNGGTISHTWDANGRETLIENRDKLGVGQFIATNTYSAVDNRLTVLEMDGTRATYAYDASQQITSEARGGTMAYARSYVWDPLGNRLQQFDSGVLTQSTFNGANQLLVSTPASGPPTTTSYDAVGNTTVINTGGALTTQVWSPDNRLASYADSKGNSEQFLYSQDGLKKQRINGAATTLFTYDEAALLLETDTSHNLQARYTHSPKTWGGLASQSRSGVSSFYGCDSQMSARILVSMAGVITDSYSWKAFGEPIQTGSGTVNPYGYIAQGLYYTELFDLINAWNRWLRASVGRWDSRDMLGFDAGDWNLYRYVRNNPVNWSDPTGLAARTCDPFLQPMLDKCKSMNPGACFSCAYLYFWGGDVCGTRNQSDHVICVRTNAFCHSHADCDNPDIGDPNQYCGRISPPGSPGGPSGPWPGGSIIIPVPGDHIPFPMPAVSCVINCIRQFGETSKDLCKKMCKKIMDETCSEIFKMCAKLEDPMNDMCMDAYLTACHGQ